MKLRYYTLRNLSIPLLFVLTSWALGFYITITNEINEETDNCLINHKNQILKTISKDSSLLIDHVDILTQYYVKEIRKEDYNPLKETFFDSKMYIGAEKMEIPLRGLKCTFRASNGKYYRLTIVTSTLEKEDMLDATIIGVSALYFSLVFCILLVIHLVFRKSLRPLYVIVDWLRNYKLGKTQTSFRNETAIEEFRILNESIEDVAQRNTDLYNKQKQFVENAAHELQTPLAICMNKLELMSEDRNCTEKQLSDMAALHNVLTGIVKMNRSLLLLSRIENRQFPSTVRLSLNNIIEVLLENFQEMYEYKQLDVRYEKKQELKVVMNESLATTLITNLLKNAFVHNLSKGEIEIITTVDTFIIKNSSNGKPLEVETLFDRYETQGVHIESTGLGLAIVKSITSLYDINVEYSFKELQHQFKLTFKTI